MHVRLTPPTGADLDRLLAAQRHHDLSYTHVGHSLRELPTEFRVTRQATSVGSDEASFRRLGDHLLGWDLHRRAGLLVRADTSTVEPDTNVVLAVPLLGVHVLAACRVVEVVDEPARVGFAYGTLPMHPESGEEAFLVERVGANVVFRITAFSRPTGTVRRLLHPVQGRIQDAFTSRYLRAAEQLAAR